ncbi:hypothetical protein KUTeg_004144 [Tegillarca granosa]|uniref:Ig-like domain-containing protein n=1 Tax=Tegillarca granosa TaxID=220873 RepID=A0ABQ9FP47_TEGGR|nr:hypothetical protein KUTeg_004144 [Tegillarca granosa]
MSNTIALIVLKAPKIKKIKGKKSVKEGRTIQLRCQIGPAKPQPKIYWEKDGVILKKGKGIQIKSGRKGSRLRVKKSKPTDSGNYVCVVKNAVSTDRMAINIRILPKNQVDSTLTPVTPSTSRFKKCPPEDDTYCLNNGECRIIVLLDYRMCK